MGWRNILDVENNRDGKSRLNSFDYTEDDCPTNINVKSLKLWKLKRQRGTLTFEWSPTHLPPMECEPIFFL